MFICTERYQWRPSEIDEEDFFDFLEWSEGARTMYDREAKARDNAGK